MISLTIIPNFYCPLNCYHCYLPKDKNEKLDIDELKKFIDENIDKVDEIKISGTEISLLSKDYIDAIIDTIPSDRTVHIESYPLNNDTVSLKDNVVYDLSYDILGRQRATTAWSNMLTFPRKFNVKITLAPHIMKTHPNRILHTLDTLDKVDTVEFIPYFKNLQNMYKLDEQPLLKYVSCLIDSKLNYKFSLLNKDYRSLNFNPLKDKTEIEVFPSAGLKVGIVKFDELYRRYVENVDSIDTVIKQGLTTNYPECYNIYS